MIYDDLAQEESVKRGNYLVAPDRLAVWKTFQSDIRGFVYSRVKDKALTDDIVHDVFLKIYEKISSVRDTSKIRSWLLTLTHHAIMDHFRKTKREIDILDLDYDDEETNLNACVTNYMKRLIETLPAKYKQAIQLTELGAMSQVEMANHLGISVSGAKSRVQRARAMLRKKLQEDLILETDRYGNVLTCEASSELRRKYEKAGHCGPAPGC